MIGTSGLTVLDFAPLATDIAQTVGYLILALLGYWLNKHVKDENARKTILDAASNGVYHAVNRIAAAGPQMNVSVASGVSAMAAKYVLDMAPDAVKRLGLDEKKIVNLVVSKLPGVDGEIDDKTMDFIASRLSGKALSSPTDWSALVSTLEPMLKQAVNDAVKSHYEGKPEATDAAPKPAAA